MFWNCSRIEITEKRLPFLSSKYRGHWCYYILKISVDRKIVELSTLLFFLNNTRHSCEKKNNRQINFSIYMQRTYIYFDGTRLESSFHALVVVGRSFSVVSLLQVSKEKKKIVSWANDRLNKTTEHTECITRERKVWVLMCTCEKCLWRTPV